MKAPEIDILAAFTVEKWKGELAKAKEQSTLKRIGA